MHAAVHRINGVSALLVLCGCLATACDQASPGGPTVALDQLFVLAPGKLASIAGTGARVQFVEVVNDSRCPLNAICIAEAASAQSLLSDKKVLSSVAAQKIVDACTAIAVKSRADIAIAVVDDQGSSRYELHTDPSRKSATHRDLRIELMELQPYPDTNRPSDPAAYRVTLRVSRK